MDSSKARTRTARKPSRPSRVATMWLVVNSLVVPAFQSQALGEDRRKERPALAEAVTEVRDSCLPSSDFPFGEEIQGVVSVAAEHGDEHNNSETGESTGFQDVRLKIDANKKSMEGVGLGVAVTGEKIFRAPGKFGLPPALPPWAQKRSAPGKSVKGGYLALGIAGLGMAGAGVYMLVDARRSRNPVTLEGIAQDYVRRESQAAWGGVFIPVGITLASVGFSKMK